VPAGVTTMLALALSREPEPAEVERLVAVADRCATARGVAPEARSASRELWRDVAHAIFLLQEFSHVE
jgi:hypothetical protein